MSNLVSIRIPIERWDTYLLPYLLLGVATVDTACGRYERGAQLIGATDAMLSATEIVLDPGDQPDYDDVVRRRRSSATMPTRANTAQVVNSPQKRLQR